MYRRRFWMHENCLDVCIEVLKNWRFKPGVLTLKVRWWNLGYSGNPFMIPNESGMPLVETIEIKVEDWKKWKCIDDIMHNPRKAPGLPV